MASNFCKKSILGWMFRTALASIKRRIYMRKVSRRTKLLDYSFRIRSDTLEAILFFLLAVLLQLMVIFMALSNDW